MVYEYQIKKSFFPNEINDLIEFKNDFLKRHFFDSNVISHDSLKVLLKNMNCEINFVCAVFGGIVGQEIIKIISRDSIPIENYFVYDGIETFSGFIEKIK